MIVEDEKVDVGPVSGDVVVSELPPSVDLPLHSETLVENVDGKIVIEDSYEVGDGEEIMVEVVGSDVFVDGVSSNSGNDFVSGEVEDSGSHGVENREENDSENVRETTAVSGEDGNELGGNELEVAASRGEQDTVGSKELEVGLREVGEDDVVCEPSQVMHASDEGVWKPGIEANAASLSANMESLTKQNEDIVERSSVPVSEERANQNEEVENASSDQATCEVLDDHVEDFGGEDNGRVDGRQTLHPGDTAASHDHLGVVSVITSEETTAASGGQINPPEVGANPGGEVLENAPVDGVVGEVGLANMSEGSLIDDNKMVSTDSGSKDCMVSTSETAAACGEEKDITTASPKDPAFTTNPDSAIASGDCFSDGKDVDENTVLTLESKDFTPQTDAFSDVLDGNQGCLNEERNEVDGFSHEQSFVSESGEIVAMDLDGVFDRKDGDSDNKLYCSNNDGNLKTGGDLETDTSQQNHEFLDEPSLQSDDGDCAKSNEDKGPKINIQAGTEGNLANMTSSNSRGEQKLVQAESGMHMNQPVTATPVAGETNDQNIAVSRGNALDANGSDQKGEYINPEITEQLSKCEETANIPELDSPAENNHLSANGACSEVQSVGTMVAENQVACNDLPQTLVEECRSHRNELDVSIQKTETPTYGIDMLGSISSVPTEVESHAAVANVNCVTTSPMISEKAEMNVSAEISLLDEVDITETWMDEMACFSDQVNEPVEAEDGSSQSHDNHIVQSHTFETKPVDMEEERELDQKYLEEHKVDSVEPGSSSEEPTSETDRWTMSNEEPVASASSLSMNQSGYLTPPENDGQFVVSDLVWGKVRSHPWWPGQIFDPADASDKAVKHYKKDSYLVAYFGDRTFAWNDASLLKPFRSHFSHIAKHSNSEAFQNAINCALEEVARRVELGLACSCIPKDAYAEIATQVVDNTGIREESSQRHGVDQSSRAASFEPDKLLKYVRDLASHGSSMADRLDLVIARAQLSAFCRFKGYRLLDGCYFSGELLETDADHEQMADDIVASRKRKHVPKGDVQSWKKERSMAELMGDPSYSPDGEDASVFNDASLSYGKKQKTADPLADGSDKKGNVLAASISTSTNQTPKPSFRIGECIRRVASQLTGSTSTVKGHNNETVVAGSPKLHEHSGSQSMVVSAESYSVDEMLSRLQLLAQDPKIQHNFLNTVVTFFTGFRSSVVVNKRSRKRKADKTIGGSAEEFEFDDVNDSYWTDRIVQNYSEKQLLNNSENGTGNNQLTPFESEKPVKSGRKSNSRKRYSSGNHPTVPDEAEEKAKRMKQESSPAELILNFAERNCIPSEINLNKTFRRFGPLMESETEVDLDSGRARVIFKRGSDAEVAHSSAEKFEIFGPVLVNYQIGYSPLISVKILPLAVPQCLEDASMMQ